MQLRHKSLILIDVVNNAKMRNGNTVNGRYQ